MAKKKVIEPARNFVLVADGLRQTTIGEIDLPDNVKQQDMVYGTVIFVGPQVSKKTKPEDCVYYGPYAGKTVIFEGMEFRLLSEEQIEFYIRTVEVQD